MLLEETSKETQYFKELGTRNRTLFIASLFCPNFNDTSGIYLFSFKNSPEVLDTKKDYSKSCL